MMATSICIYVETEAAVRKPRKAYYKYADGPIPASGYPDGAIAQHPGRATKVYA